MNNRKRNRNLTSSNSMSYQLNDNVPILNIKNSVVSETNKKLFRGTIIEGFLKTRIVNLKGNKIPFKFIQLKDESGYISPKAVDLYISLSSLNQSNFDASKESLIEEKKDDLKNVKKQKTNKLIAYGLPVATSVLGWHIAKKMGLDLKNQVLVSIVCLLLGSAPNYMIKNKQK